MAKNRVFTLIQVTFIALALIAAVEYFKYSTRVNYESIHCTSQLTTIPGRDITRAIAFGGPSCDKRGQLKSITKKLMRTFDPNIEPLAFCIKEEGDIIAGYVAKADEEEALQLICPDIIHLNDVAK